MIKMNSLIHESANSWTRELQRGVDRDEAFSIMDFPIKALSISKKAASLGMDDIKHGRGSKTQKPVDVMYNIDYGQFIITDGYHRVLEAIMRKEKTIKIKVWSTTYSDYYSSVRKEDLLFEPTKI